MPGNFFFEQNSTVRCARFNASPFLPPQDDSAEPSSPWSQNSRPARSLASTSQSSHNRDRDQQHSRKRLRLDTRSTENSSFDNSRSWSREALSPPPLVNTDYRIAGGLDTPSALNAQIEEDSHEFDYEIDCRPSRYNSQNSSQPTDSYFPQTPALKENGKNKRQLSPPSPPMKGWGKAVWAVTGGFAGKVFNFCWNTTFKGFYAGGGNGYTLDLGTPSVATKTWVAVDSKDDVFHNDYNGSSRRGVRESTPVPGGFPEDGPEFIEDYMSKLTVDQPQKIEATPTKFGQNEPTSISRYNSWVVVDDTNSRSESREVSPARKKSRASTANLHSPRPSPASRHSSHALGRPRATPRASLGRTSASHASPRPSIGPNFASFHEPRRSKSSIPIIESHKAPSDIEKLTKTSQSPKRASSGHASRASLSSPRRQSSIMSNPVQKQSPEVRKFEQKMRKKEARQDETMNRFNDRLQAMIREGQAALGSRVEVEIKDDTDDSLDQGCFADRFGDEATARWGGPVQQGKGMWS